MKLHALDIPESHADRVAWLERLIAGPELGDVAAELAVVHGAATNGQTLDGLLGGAKQAVIDKGLAALPEPAFQQLLGHPTLLLQLQERVLAAASPYWDKLLGRHDEVVTRSRRIAARTLSAIGALDEARTPPPSGGSWLTHPLLVCLVTAAAVAGILFGVQPWQPTPTPVAAGWGWSKPGAINATLTPHDYLRSLAVAAEDWFKKRPDDAAGVALRIAQFRQGCSQLILAEHRPLAPEDKVWLVERCQAWAKKLDDHLAAVESGRAPAEVRAEADVTIKKLVDAINTRAATLGPKT